MNNYPRSTPVNLSLGDNIIKEIKGMVIEESVGGEYVSFSKMVRILLREALLYRQLKKRRETDNEHK